MPSVHHGGEIGGGTLFFFTILLVLLALYLQAAWRQGRIGRGWSAWRVSSFVTGIVLLGAAVTPALGSWAMHDLRGHMVQHLLLGMMVPLGLVLGAPGLLLLRTVPAATGRRIVRCLALRPVRGLIHPLTALVLDVGVMYLLYLTPLYAWSLGNAALHHVIHLHFVIAGYLFTWSVIGLDPAPHRPGPITRLAALFLATATHATLGKLMYAYGYPRGTPHGPEEIQAAAQIMYYGGDLVELGLIVVFFATWGRRPASPISGWISMRSSLRSRGSRNWASPRVMFAWPWRGWPR